ncbi:MAG: Ig-like domain-containing domain [Bacillota bacterium]
MKPEKKRYSILFIAILTIMLCVVGAFTAVAAGGDGTGGGGGTGGGSGTGGENSDPLTLAASSPANGQKDVPLTSNIKLTFNKNVVNMAVKENNLKSIGLYTAADAKVPVEITMADDQIQPEYKDDITINPVNELLPSTTYKVIIAPELTAKNGTVLGKQVVITFTTVGESQTAENNTGSTKTTSTEVKQTNTTTAPNQTLKTGTGANQSTGKGTEVNTGEVATNNGSTETNEGGNAPANEVTQSDTAVSSDQPVQNQNEDGVSAATTGAEADSVTEEAGKTGWGVQNYIILAAVLVLGVATGYIYIKRRNR